MISIFLPAYKEAENLKKILPKISTVMNETHEPYEILVVDTIAPMDDTEAVCKENGARYIARENGNMYGDAIRTGIIKAVGDFIVVMDADGSHNPEDIPRLMARQKEDDSDIVIGSRYCKGGHTDNNFILRFMSWTLNITYRICFGLRVKDVSDSYRIYKAAPLKKLELECNNFDIVEEILIRLKYSINGIRIAEVPISFNKRDAGESKRDLKKFIVSYIGTMFRLMKIRFRMKGC